MKISLIAAIAKNHAIGLNNRLMWHLPDDLKYFKNKTLEHYVLMGRKTFLSLDNELKGRKTIVVTRDKEFNPGAPVIVHSIESGIEYARLMGERELFICGGEQIYRQTIESADRLYLTHVNHEFRGDTYFPKFDPSEWNIRKSIPFEKDSRNEYAFVIKEYERGEEGIDK